MRSHGTSVLKGAGGSGALDFYEPQFELYLSDLKIPDKYVQVLLDAHGRQFAAKLRELKVQRTEMETPIDRKERLSRLGEYLRHSCSLASCVAGAVNQAPMRCLRWIKGNRSKAGCLQASDRPIVLLAATSFAVKRYGKGRNRRDSNPRSRP